MASSRTSETRAQARSAPPKLKRGKVFGCETPRVWTPPLRPLTPSTTKGFECIRFAEDILGIDLLPWQKWLLLHALELREDGTYRFRTVVVLVARQNGKSTLMQVLSLWRMYMDRRAPLVIGTAQNLDIAEELWQGAVDMAQGVDELAGEIDKVDLTNGKKALKLTTGARYKVQAATRRGGRGLSGDLILMDELREHQNWEAWSAVTKTTMARRYAQIWTPSNAGDRTSVVLAHLRMLAHIALGDPDDIYSEQMSEGIGDLVDDSLGIFEWSAPPDCSLDDMEAAAQANPSLGYTIDVRAILAARSTDPEAKYRTEVLCQWVDSLREGGFPASVWATSKVDDPPRITRAPTVCVDVRTGVSQSLSIVVVGGTDEGYDLVHVARYETGNDWDYQYAVNCTLGVLAARGLRSVVIDKYGENMHLVPLFEDAGIRVLLIDTTDARAGAVAFSDGVFTGLIKHKGQEPLDIAVIGAGKRVTDAGFVWSQTRSTTDISPLRAATAAWWAYTRSLAVEYDVLESAY
ncbi:hypothetical protein QT381_02600 [Galbitalea sp. SE-J8]|uniref:hypothetical protein n=1 Tax=Galbitalea sp. SE-J8 TaxID=3054952 RepID=UPI00259CD3F9|nr:hypothetical protein [Galbitalea sp. SE-J8]MDM4761893.1 hypothetical protein [Galbitalea sp. SE-J8]